MPELIARIAGQSYGRLLAVLAAPTGDIPAAEDAVADALERALTRWPRDGVPDNPEGWLVTVARNRMRDRWKSHTYRITDPLPDDDCAATGSGSAAGLVEDTGGLPDRRLELMLVCAHPAIGAGVRTPLMLQTVLGVDAAVIARAFVVEPATMAQRLVRAKKRIKAARIPFLVPGRDDLAQRLPALLEAVYGAYAIDWQAAGQDAALESLAGEALHLASVLAEVLPDEPEVLGLAAMISLAEARRGARHGSDGRFVPLDEQDPARWDAGLIERGEALLARAHRSHRPGRYQYEAAIQSAHCDRARTGGTDWVALRTLHRALARVAPSLGSAVALAAVEAQIDGPAAGLAQLDAIADPAVERFQPLWATRAHLLASAGDRVGAAAALDRAIALTTDDSVAAYLRGTSG